MQPRLRPFPLLLLVGLVCCGSASARQALDAKQVAAPAADILAGILQLPDPAAHATSSRAALIQVDLAHDGQSGWSFETTLPVPREGPLALALLGPDAAGWRLRVRGADGTLQALESLAAVGSVERSTQVLSEDMPGWVIQRYDLAQAPAGRWIVHVDAPAARGAQSPGFLIARDAAPVQLAVHASTQLLLGDSEIGLLARLTAGGELRSARAIVRTTRGVQELVLRDDGLNQDGRAGDGVFGALLPPWTHGEVRALVEVEGLDEAGGELLRGVQIHFPVLERRLVLAGAASTRIEDELRLRIELHALPLAPAQKLHVSAEVWGTDAQGEPVPVCWLSRMLQPEEQAGEWRLPLFLDGRWLDVAAASLPLELRNVRVQDPDTHVPFDLLERIVLDVVALPATVGQGSTRISTQMLAGPPPVTGTSTGSMGPQAPATRLPVQRALMLVHGYCSGGAIWPAADFSEPKLVFLDPSANRTHDQFAQLLAQAGGALYSFGIVGHSQGGAAALHLYTYYNSPLDLALGQRRIQSVATPYQGTPLASLGGFACGVNNDMTPSGAALWLAGIPSWARAEVSFWTTSNSGSACNFLASLFLDDPEDGTVEQVRGQLPGANSMGHVTGWCHTTGMSNPANYTDHARNALMNAAAAR